MWPVRALFGRNVADVGRCPVLSDVFAKLVRATTSLWEDDMDILTPGTSALCQVMEPVSLSGSVLFVPWYFELPETCLPDWVSISRVTSHRMWAWGRTAISRGVGDVSGQRVVRNDSDKMVSHVFFSIHAL